MVAFRGDVRAYMKRYKLRKMKGQPNNFLARKCWRSYSMMISICLMVVAAMKSAVKLFFQIKKKF